MNGEVEMIYRGYRDTEVASLWVNVQCPYCGHKFQEYDLTDCGTTYHLTCESDECGKDFDMYFDAD